MIEWKPDQYGPGQTLELSRILFLYITMKMDNSEKYTASVFGAKLKTEYDNADDAKLAAVVQAEKTLKFALINLENRTENKQ